MKVLISEYNRQGRFQISFREGYPVPVITQGSEDLRKYNLAENVSVSYDGPIWGFEVTFDFLCPNCGKRHWAREHCIVRLFSTVILTLHCGEVCIRMPWAVLPNCDEKSIYGQLKRHD